MSAGIRDAISKLTLKRGDILVVSEPWVRDVLLNMRPPEGIDFQVPVVFAPTGSLLKAGRKELEDALEMLEVKSAVSNR